MSDETGGQAVDLFKSVKYGDFRALAKFLTTLERTGLRSFEHYPQLLEPVKPAFRIGLTGPPGAGKSTLIGRLIGLFRAQKQRVGVLAVDPSSPFTKGAVLGDRIRYSDHFNDPGVFIRSLASRGSLGGLSSATYLMARAFDLANFDIVLIETVGVGQTELEIMNIADFVSVVLVPESGDSIQAMKAGLLEIADIFVVNKSDRPESERFANELESSMLLGPSGPSVLRTTATTGAGLEEFLSKIAEARVGSNWKKKRLEPTRLQAEAQAMLRHQTDLEIRGATSAISDPKGFLKAVRSFLRR